MPSAGNLAEHGVILKTKDNKDLCWRLPYDRGRNDVKGPKVYGVEEVLMKYACDETDSKQIFYVYPDESDKTKFLLRPKYSVENKLDVCLRQDNGVTD